MNQKKGFTLIEILIVLGVLVLLMAIVIVAINPLEHFRNANNLQRKNDLRAIMDAITQNIISNKGSWNCSAGNIPAAAANMADGISDPAGYDICSCIVPDYVTVMPTDPTDGNVTIPTCALYDSQYTIFQDAVSGRITMDAPHAQGETITLTR